MKRISLYLLAMAGVLSQNIALAQDKDNSGTNPANFTYDARFYSEMAGLANSNGSYLTNILEFRWPLGKDIAKTAGIENDGLVNDLGKKFGARMRFRYKDLNIENPGDEPFDNSSHEALGFGANVLAPTLFFVFPGLLGKGSLLAPGYQYLFDVDGGDLKKIKSQPD